MMLQEIFNTDASINEEYRASKHKKFIKKYIASRRRKKLRKITNKFYDMSSYSYEDLAEILTYCSLKYDDGKIGYITKVSVLNDSRGLDYNHISAVLNYEYDNVKYIYLLQLDRDSKDRTTINISATMKLEKGNKSFSYTPRTNLAVMESDTGIKGDMLNGLISMIGDTLKIIIEDVFKRSERIYENE